jgi:hypothetical protein
MHVGGDLVTIPAKLVRDPALFGGGNSRVLWGGVLVSLVCFALALQRVWALGVLETGDPATASRAIVLLASYPFALFFGQAYSESVFLLVFASTVLEWRRGELRRAAAWGVVTGLTRSNGWTLSAALLADVLLSRRENRQPAARWIAALSPLAGAALFSMYVYSLTGDPFEWAAAQQGWGRHMDPVAFAARPLHGMSELGLAAYVASRPVEALTLVCTCLLLAGALVNMWRRQWLYAALIVCYLAPAIAIDLPATGRLTSVLFPFFITLAVFVRRPAAFLALAAVFATGQAYLAARFFLWQSPF